MCTFCRFNTSPDAPQVCQDHPDWMKKQIGTLDCEHSKRFFNKNFETCILKDPLPCSSVRNLILGSESTKAQLRNKSWQNRDINLNAAMVQIDVEAYEYILLPGLLKEFASSATGRAGLPPVIHFEEKVMIDQDRKRPLPSGEKRFHIALRALESHGYVMYTEGEDTLALLLS